MGTEIITTFSQLQNALHVWHLDNMKEAYEEHGRTAYRKALKSLGFSYDGYDMYGSNCYSNGSVRAALYYDHGDCCWYVEEAVGESDTTDNFYNTSNDTPDINGIY